MLLTSESLTLNCNRYPFPKVLGSSASTYFAIRSLAHYDTDGSDTSLAAGGYLNDEALNLPAVPIPRINSIMLVHYATQEYIYMWGKVISA
jgi:hypothetical protein